MIRYTGTSNGVSTEFTHSAGINYLFQACNQAGPVAALGSAGMLFDDCTSNNYAFWNGASVIKEKIEGISMNLGGFWHPEGAVLFGQGQQALDCDFSSTGIVFVAEDRSVTGLGCVSGFIGLRHWDLFTDNPNPKVIPAGDFFIVKGQTEIWVFDTKGWKQKVLDGFTPINLSLGDTTLFYDGMDEFGNYVAGRVDVVTGVKSDLGLSGKIRKIIAFQ